MNTSLKLIALRVAFALFVALFFVTPICSLFVPFCSVKWMLGVSVVTTLLYVLSTRWNLGEAGAGER